MTTATFNSSGTWTAPAGVTTVDVACWGEGGAGGSSAHGSHSGGGAGAGEYAGNTSVPVTPGSVYSFTIGAGGAGTSTVFTGDASTVVTAHFGASSAGQTAGAGGTGSTAPVHSNGGAGAAGSLGSSVAGSGGGGSGGASGAGGAGSGAAGGSAGAGGGASGGAGGTALAAGSAGNIPGSGGGGGGSGGSINHSGGAGAAGQIVLTYSASISHPGAGSFAGLGAMSAAWLLAATGALTGTGAMTAAGLDVSGHGAVLSGTGAMAPAHATTRPRSAGLSGSGSFSGHSVGFSTATLSGTGVLGATVARQFRGALSGFGALSNAGIVRGRSPALSGQGALTVLRVLGVITAGASHGPIVTAQAWPGASQVAVSPPGSSQKYWLGTLGDITALKYSFACPGGCDQMSATVMVPAAYRTQLFNPGWTVRIFRGGHQVWDGKLDEPQPVANQGWNLSAVGTGNLGQDYRALYTGTWPSGQPDQAINAAVVRGLPWVNPGVGQPAGAWFGQAVDSASQSISDLLALMTTRGGLLWYVNSQPGGALGDNLTVSVLPSVPNRLIVATQPVARTLGGDINTIFIRYQVTADNSDTNTQASYAVTVVQNAASVALHGELETYTDLSDAGVLTAAQAQQVGNYILQIYQRATFAGPYTVHYGELLNLGGQPIDPGTDQAGTMARLIMTDFAFGGEVTPMFPVEFIVGGYEWDDFAQAATVTPYQVLNQSVSGLLSLENTLLQPITTSGG